MTTRHSHARQRTHRATPSDDALSFLFHELTTPLSSLQGYVSLLLSGELGALTSRQRDTVTRMEELTRYTGSMLMNIRQLSQFGNERVGWGWKPLEMGQLVRGVCRDLVYEARRRHIALAAKTPQRLPPFWAEEDGLRQALMNLVHNAVKFTPERGRVTVAAHASNGVMTLSVKDTGVGIAREMLPKIFQKFYHLDRPEVGATGGTGLGLAIVKQVVERHHGSVFVNSAPGKGSEFRMVLPRRDSMAVIQDVLEHMGQHEATARQPLTVLVLRVRGIPARGRPAVVMNRLQRILQETIRVDDRMFVVPEHRVIVVVMAAALKDGRTIAGRIAQRAQHDTVFRRQRGVRIQLGMAAAPLHGRRASRLLRGAQTNMTWLDVGAHAQA